MYVSEYTLVFNDTVLFLLSLKLYEKQKPILYY